MAMVLRYVLQYIFYSLFVCVYCEELFAYVCNMDKSVQVQKVCKEEFNSRQFLMPSNESLYLRYPIYSVDPVKYFHESLFNKYCDQRYVSKGADDTLEEKASFRKSLVVEWSNFAKDQNLLFWISNESLLGWYWQRSVLPWDHVPSVQVLYFDLLRYYSKLSGILFKDRYLFDVNPNSEIRVHQKHNTIDARFIDTKSGYFLDLAAVSYDGFGFHAKAHRSYSADTLFPLRKSIFEGLEVWIPNNAVGVLSDEFGSARLSSLHFQPSFWNIRYLVRKGKRRRPQPRIGTDRTYNFNTTLQSWSANVVKVNLNWKF